MTAFWRNLSDRERIVIIAAATFMGLGLAYFAVISPIVGWRSAAESGAVTAERNFELVRQAAARRPVGGKNENVDTETPARVVMARTETDFGFRLTQYNELPGGSVTASIDDVSADTVFAWISALEKRYGIVVVSANVARDNEDPSLIRAQFTLGRV